MVLRLRAFVRWSCYVLLDIWGFWDFGVFLAFALATPEGVVVWYLGDIW